MIYSVIKICLLLNRCRFVPCHNTSVFRKADRIHSLNRGFFAPYNSLNICINSIDRIFCFFCRCFFNESHRLIIKIGYCLNNWNIFFCCGFWFCNSLGSYFWLCWCFSVTFCLRFYICGCCFRFSFRYIVSYFLDYRFI